METLLVGRPGLERSLMEKSLVDAGHRVNHCHDGDWACVGMSAVCPLDARSIDVAVAIADAGDRFDAQGVGCAVRARIPLIVVAATPHDPVLRYATIAVEAPDARLLEAIEAVRLLGGGDHGHSASDP